MTDFDDYPAILSAIGTGIDAARRNPKGEAPGTDDEYLAWCILQELRRAGWSIEPTPD
jgi:hypothetical protein